MFKKSALIIATLALGLLLSGFGLAANSDEFEQKDITYPEGENYSRQQTTAKTDTPGIEQDSSVKPTSTEPNKAEKYIVTVPVSEQGNRNSVELPGMGMSKDDVEVKWGQPNSARNAVGKPPISSWIYDDFTVYFESGHVIRSVLNPYKAH